jgi:hypothetical protein
MGTIVEVDRWFAATKPPAEATLRRLRGIILGADSRVTEYVKYGTVTFGYGGDLAAFVQLNQKIATLMFNRGGRIRGRFPHLEGEGPSARFMRFADVAEVEARADELRAIAAAWCALPAAVRAPAAARRRKPAEKAKPKAKAAAKPRSAATKRKTKRQTKGKTRQPAKAARR